MFINDTELDEQKHAWMLKYSVGAVIPILVYY